MVRNTIHYTYACGKDKGYAALRCFDDSSLVFGASLVGAIDATINNNYDKNNGNDRASRRSRLCEAKGRMMRRAGAQCNRGPDPRIALGTQRLPRQPPAEYRRIHRVPQRRRRLAILGRVQQCDAGGDGVTAGRVEAGRCARRSTKHRTEILMKNKNNADKLFSVRNYPRPGMPRP